MSYSKKRGAAQYGQVSVGSEAEFASPHRLVQMLMEGALDKLAKAKGHLMRDEIAEKGQQITWAISILEGLRGSLDMDAGEIATNLDDLYDYMNRRLVEANIRNDVEIINEIISLLLEIKTGWDGIGNQLQTKTVAS